MQGAEEIITKAMQWMVSRGWKSKLAKKRGKEQTLFEHSLIELDVLLQLLPILERANHYKLTDTEQRMLIVAVIVHDVGKERDEWQAYVANQSPSGQWVPHILPELTQAVVPEVCRCLGFEGLGNSVEQIVVRCADFHHSRPGSSDGAIMGAILAGGSDRFLALAHIVRAIDRSCSAPNATEAVEALDREPALRSHLRLAIHEAVIRGVSTVFLHGAAQAAFSELGWRALLYFNNATVYAADPNDNPLEPGIEAIQLQLKKTLDKAIERDVTPLMVGSPTGNILPKPDLFEFKDSRKYLEAAGRKVGPKSFARRPLKTRRKVVADYWKFSGKTGVPTETEVEMEAQRISAAQPEMMVFKFFKAMLDPERIESIGEKGVEAAHNLYEAMFGADSWASLQSTSTLMPAKDMAKTVDRFWALPSDRVGRPNARSVAELPDQDRLDLLIDLLNEIAQKVYGMNSAPSPRDQVSLGMAEMFVRDLVRPHAIRNPQDLAAAQLDSYIQSKPFAGKESAKAKYFCPICNLPFTINEGRKASADFIDNPQGHTNRAVSHGSFGYIMICGVCYYERLLRQVLLGSRPAEVITLMPRLNIGPGKGQRFVRAVHEWIESAQRQMRGETGSVENGFSLAFTYQAASHVGDRDPYALEANELTSIFGFRFGEETQKKRRRELLKRLKEEFDEDLNALNDACDGSFTDWEAVVQALVENKVHQQELKAIRREVFRLYETVHLVCETPNLIFVPLTYEIAAGDDESETNKALRRLYVALLLSIVFDAAVDLHREGEPPDFSNIQGAARVPQVPSVRSLIGFEWVPIADAPVWLSAIGAASLLARDTGFPSRSALYQILAADPPERLARRIEEDGQRDGRRINLTVKHLRWIENVIEARRREASL